MNLYAERAKVRRRFPHAYAYKWARGDWVIYAAKRGPWQGIPLTGSCTSNARAWISAARDVNGFHYGPKIKVPWRSASTGRTK